MDDKELQVPDEFERLLSEGRAAGELMLVCESLPGREVFCTERSEAGVAFVDVAFCDGERVEISLRRRRPDGSVDGGAPARLGYPCAHASIRPGAFSLNAGYGVNSHIVHHPIAIEYLRGLPMQDARRLARGDAPLPASIVRMIRDEPFPTPQRTRGEPRCLVREGKHGRCVVELRDLPFQDTRCLAWATDRLHVAVMAVFLACQPAAPDLMNHLVQRDREWCRDHPDALPAVAADAEELFASRPELAMLYHQPFGGASLNGNLGSRELMRVLTHIGERCGFVCDR